MPRCWLGSISGVLSSSIRTISSRRESTASWPGRVADASASIIARTLVNRPSSPEPRDRLCTIGGRNATRSSLLTESNSNCPPTMRTWFGSSSLRPGSGDGVSVGRSSKATIAASPAPPRRIQAGGSVNSRQSPGSRLCSAVPGSWKRQCPLTTRPKTTPLSAGTLQAQSPCPTMCFHSNARGRSNSTSWVSGSTGTIPIRTICNLFGTSNYRSSRRLRIRWVLVDSNGGTDMTKTVLITGCSSGFGKAAATKFHDRGWNVIATMRDPDDWDGGSSDRLLSHALDVTDPASIRSAFDAGVARFGSVDVVVNAPGIGLFSVFETTTDETVRSVFETNLFGPIEIMRVAVPHLREHGGGRIVNLTSASSIVPEPLMGIYNASKAALDNLTETLRLELSPQNIVLKLIEPGFVPTTRLVEKAQTNAPVLTIVPPEYEAYVNQRMAIFNSEFPVKLATPEDVADAILASVNDETGQLRWVVGADQAERMHMRHETSEAEYNDWTWSQLGPSR